MKIELLYNNILIKSRNIHLYKNCKIKDTLQNKIILILIFFSFIFNKLKNFNIYNNQKIFDFFFLKIETDLREIGFGDMKINKIMKIIVNKFYSILIDFDDYLNKSKKHKHKLISKLLKSNKHKDLDCLKIVKYFDKFAKSIDLISINDIYNSKI